ncbi:MAG: GNAT family N-acetyltransferase [Gemmatimonadales bacterium]
MLDTLLTTERLLLRRFAPNDAADVEGLASAWEVADTTLRIPHPYPAGGGGAWIAMHLALVDARVATVFAITERRSGALVGAIGIEIAEGGREGELGYWVGVPHWGRGYATEAAGAMVAHAFSDAWSLERLTARYFIRNPASGRVLEKIGMRDVEPVTVSKGDRAEEAMLRAIAAHEWRARSRPS